MRARLALPLVVVLIAAMVVVARVRADGQTVQGQSTPSSSTNVQVTTDLQSYAPGATVTVSVINLGPATIMPRGGRVCDSLWPVRLEEQDQNGWSSVPVPQDSICAGASVAPYDPGESLTKTFTAGPDEGTYRVVFAYDVPGGEYGSLPPAYSDPFTVQS